MKFVCKNPNCLYEENDRDLSDVNCPSCSDGVMVEAPDEDTEQE